MSIELPRDAEGREIPLDTEVLYDLCETKYVSCLGCGARTDLEYADEFAADLWNERVSHVE